MGLNWNKLPEITRRLCIRHTTSKTNNLAYIKTIIDDLKPIIFVSRERGITLLTYFDNHQFQSQLYKLINNSIRLNNNFTIRILLLVNLL